MTSNYDFYRYILEKVKDYVLPSIQRIYESWKNKNILLFFAQAFRVAVLFGVSCIVITSFFYDLTLSICMGVVSGGILLYVISIAWLIADSVREAFVDFNEGARGRGELFPLFLASRMVRWFIPSFGTLKNEWVNGNFLGYIGQVRRFSIATAFIMAIIVMLFYGAIAALLVGIAVLLVMFIAMFYALEVITKIRTMRKEFEESRQKGSE